MVLFSIVLGFSMMSGWYWIGMVLVLFEKSQEWNNWCNSYILALVNLWKGRILRSVYYNNSINQCEGSEPLGSYLNFLPIFKRLKWNTYKIPSQNLVKITDWREARSDQCWKKSELQNFPFWSVKFGSILQLEQNLYFAARNDSRLFDRKFQYVYSIPESLAAVYLFWQFWTGQVARWSFHLSGFLTVTKTIK